MLLKHAAVGVFADTIPRQHNFFLNVLPQYFLSQPELFRCNKHRRREYWSIEQYPVW